MIDNFVNNDDDDYDVDGNDEEKRIKRFIFYIYKTKKKPLKMQCDCIRFSVRYLNQWNFHIFFC